MLGLGMSVGTLPGGITADTVVVSNFDELARLGREKVQGKIVVYNYTFTNYGSGRMYRSNGASRAAALGAVAALVRSATPLAMQAPHTGAMEYDPEQPKIPAAAITPEDALHAGASLCRGHPGEGPPGDGRARCCPTQIAAT